MAKVTDRLAAMRDLSADAYGDTWIDDLSADYDDDVAEAVAGATADAQALIDGSEAKLQELTGALTAQQDLNTQLKAQNYDLLTAVGTPAAPDEPDDEPDDDDDDPTAGFFE